MKGCCHFTDGEQKSGACKDCAEADCGTALMHSSGEIEKTVNNKELPRSVLKNTLTDVTWSTVAITEKMPSCETVVM